MTYFFTLKANWGGGEMVVVVIEETFKAAQNFHKMTSHIIIIMSCKSKLIQKCQQRQLKPLLQSFCRQRVLTYPACLKIAMPKTLAKCFCSKIVQSLGSNFTSCNYYGKAATNGHVALNSIFCIFSHNNAAKLCEKLQKKSYCLV